MAHCICVRQLVGKRKVRRAGHTPTGSAFAAAVLIVAAVAEALVTSLSELEAFAPPPRLPLMMEPDPP